MTGPERERCRADAKLSQPMTSLRTCDVIKRPVTIDEMTAHDATRWKDQTKPHADVIEDL